MTQTNLYMEDDNLRLYIDVQPLFLDELENSKNLAAASAARAAQSEEAARGWKNDIEDYKTGLELFYAQATDGIENLYNSSVSDIGNEKTSAISDLQSQKTNIQNSLNATYNNALNNIRTNGQAYVDMAHNYAEEAKHTVDNRVSKDHLNQSKGLETGSVSDDEEVLSDIKKYAHSTFDRSKFTAVGSPNVTDDGIASGFSVGNILKISIDNTPIESIKLKGKCTYNVPASGQSLIFYGNGTYGTPSLAIMPNNIIRFYSYDGSVLGSVDITTSDFSILEGEYFYYECEISNTQRTFKISKDKQNWFVKTNTTVQSLNLAQLLTSLFIGGTYQYACLGSIDLKQFSITVDGEEVFNGHQEGIDVLKPNDFTTATTIYAYKFGDNTVYSNVTNNTNPTELYNADGSYYLGTAFDIINNKVTYPEQATRGADDITIDGVTYYEFEHTTGGSSTNIYADDPTTPTALFNSDGSEYTGTQWNIMSSKVYYLNDATYTPSANIIIHRDYNTVDAGVKISDDGIASGFSDRAYLESSLAYTNGNSLMVDLEINTLSTWTSFYSSEIVLQIKKDTNNYLEFKIIKDRTIRIENKNNGTLTYRDFSNIDILNKKDNYKLILNNGDVKLYKSGLELTSTITGTTFGLPTDTYFVNIGRSTTTNGWFYSGSIDLNAFKIYVDGNLVYQPCLKIPYTESSGKYGSKIVSAVYRDRVKDAYEQGYQQRYYTLDEENGNFTLPMGDIYGMIENLRQLINQMAS